MDGERLISGIGLLLCAVILPIVAAMAAHEAGIITISVLP